MKSGLAAGEFDLSVGICHLSVGSWQGNARSLGGYLVLSTKVLRPRGATARERGLLKG